MSSSLPAKPEAPVGVVQNELSMKSFSRGSIGLLSHVSSFMMSELSTDVSLSSSAVSSASPSSSLS